MLERIVIQECLLPKASISERHICQKGLATPAIDAIFNAFPRRNLCGALKGHCLGLSAQMLIDLKLE